jgi:hypothetical protein
MESHEIEVWARKVIAAIKQGQANEDSRVEIKAVWPIDDINKAARRLAGHANAARGQTIMWLVGVDPAGVLLGAASDGDKWYKMLSSEFNEEVPQLLQDLVIHEDGKAIAALVFATDRRPYVVKNAAYGKVPCAVELEVPWREQTSVRTAKRSELLQLLSPLQALPQFEVMNGTLKFERKEIDSEGKSESYLQWKLELKLYSESEYGKAVIVPFHRCDGWYQISGITRQLSFNSIRLSPPYKSVYGRTVADYKSEVDSHTVKQTHSEVIISGPGLLHLHGDSITRDFDGKPFAESIANAQIQINLHPIGHDIPAMIVVEMRPHKATKDRTTVVWSFGSVD